MKQFNKHDIRNAVCGQYGKTAEGCCGGSVPKDTDACCVADAESKAAGEGGCGCGDTPSSDNNSAQGACCSAPAPSPDEIS